MDKHERIIPPLSPFLLECLSCPEKWFAFERTILNWFWDAQVYVWNLRVGEPSTTIVHHFTPSDFNDSFMDTLKSNIFHWLAASMHSIPHVSAPAKPWVCLQFCWRAAPYRFGCHGDLWPVRTCCFGSSNERCMKKGENKLDCQQWEGNTTRNTGQTEEYEPTHRRVERESQAVSGNQSPWAVGYPLFIRHVINQAVNETGCNKKGVHCG